MSTADRSRGQVAPELSPPTTRGARQALGRKIALHRNQHGLSRPELGELLGLSEAKVADLEQGWFTVTPALFGKLLDFMPEVFEQVKQKTRGPDGPPWSDQDIQRLEQWHTTDNKSFAWIAAQLGRTEMGVRNAWYRYKLAKKYPNWPHAKDNEEGAQVVELPIVVAATPLPSAEAPPAALKSMSNTPDVSELLLEMLQYIEKNMALMEGGVELKAANMSCAMTIKWMALHVTKSSSDC